MNNPVCENEIWLPIPGLNDIYWASNIGRIKSYALKNRPDGTILKHITTQTYTVVTTRVKGEKAKASKVHRLLAMTFIANPNEYPFINHKDGDKANNNLDNLEWCNHSMNMKHAHAAGFRRNDTLSKWAKQMKETNDTHFNCKGIVVRTRSNEFVAQFSSPEKAGSFLNAGASYISMKARKNGQVRGYNVSYI